MFTLIINRTDIMGKFLQAVLALSVIVSCNMENPLLTESPNPYGAPQFDKIKNSHYLPAFKAGIEEAKAEIDAITSNPDAPDFANTIEALEYSGRTLDRVSAIFFNLETLSLFLGLFIKDGMTIAAITPIIISVTSTSASVNAFCFFIFFALFYLKFLIL